MWETIRKKLPWSVYMCIHLKCLCMTVIRRGGKTSKKKKADDRKLRNKWQDKWKIRKISIIFCLHKISSRWVWWFFFFLTINLQETIIMVALVMGGFPCQQKKFGWWWVFFCYFSSSLLVVSICPNVFSVVFFFLISLHWIQIGPITGDIVANFFRK